MQKFAIPHDVHEEIEIRPYPTMEKFLSPLDVHEETIFQPSYQLFERTL